MNSSDKLRFAIPASDLAEIDSLDDRRTSRLAIASVVVGVAASLALASSWFVLLPVIGALLATGAALAIRFSPDSLGGTRLALLSGCLSLLFGTWSIGGDWYERSRLTDLATRFNTRWLELLRDGHVKEAYRLTLEPHLREDAAALAAETAEEPSRNRSRYHGFLEKPEIKRLTGAGEQSTLRFHQTHSLLTVGHITRVQQSFYFLRDEQTETALLYIDLERRFDPTTNSALWTILHLSETEKTTP